MRQFQVVGQSPPVQRVYVCAYECKYMCIRAGTRLQQEEWIPTENSLLFCVKKVQQFAGTLHMCSVLQQEVVEGEEKSNQPTNYFELSFLPSIQVHVTILGQFRSNPPKCGFSLRAFFYRKKRHLCLSILISARFGRRLSSPWNLYIRDTM